MIEVKVGFFQIQLYKCSSSSLSKTTFQNTGGEMGNALDLESRDPAWPHTNWVSLACPTPGKWLILLQEKTELHQIHFQGPFRCEDNMKKANKPLEKPPQEMSSNPCTEPPQMVTHSFPTNSSNKLGHSKSGGKWKNRTRKPVKTTLLTESDSTMNLTFNLILRVFIIEHASCLL